MGLCGYDFNSTVFRSKATANYYRKLTNDGAQVLTNSASLNEFRDSWTYHQQARQFAQFIAAANARPFVQGARGGLAIIVDSDGKIISKTDGFGMEVINANLEFSSSKNPYVRFGEWTALAAGLIVFVTLFVGSFVDKKK